MERNLKPGTWNLKPPSWRRRLRRRLRELGLWTAVEYAQFLGFRLVEAAFAALPLPWAAALGRALGRAAFHLLPRARAEALKNLHLAFGDTLDAQGRADLARRSFEHFGAALPEALQFPRHGRAARLACCPEIEGLGLVEEARRAGRGVLWAVAHLGNWEFAGLYAAAAGIPCAAVARPMPNPFIEAEVRRLRTRTGQRMFDRAGALREVLRALKGGTVVSMVLDVEPDAGGVEVEFFGRPTRLLETAGVLAVRTGCAVVPAWVVRDGPMRYRIGCAARIEARPGAASETEVARIAREVAGHFEAFIRRAPEQYAWSLRRWREVPAHPHT